jgi:hypothetical protein
MLMASPREVSCGFFAFEERRYPSEEFMIGFRWGLGPWILAALTIGAHGAYAQNVASASSPAGEAEQTEARSTDERIEELDQRVRILARLLELAHDSAVAAARSQPAAVASRDGFALRSADGSFVLRLRGYLQADSRFYGAGTTGQTNSLLLRRARPVLEATLYDRFVFKIMPDFGDGTTVLNEGYGEARLWPVLAVRAGKFKPPIGLERLQSATDLRFIERGLPTGLVPNRDVGVQLSGQLDGGRIGYQAGVFNGLPDLGNADLDTQASKDFAARLFLQPLLAASTGTSRAISSSVRTTRELPSPAEQLAVTGRPNRFS